MASIWDPVSALAPVAAVPGMRAAVLVPIYEDDGHLRLIMTRRPDDMRHHPGDVVFPGGMIEHDDGGPVETALREAEEEIGLPRANVEVLGALDVVHTRSATMRIVPVVARVRRPDTLVPEPGEVAAIIEPRITDLLRDEDWRTSRWFGRTMWFYEFPEGTLWGATAHMVRILLDHFRASRPSA
jgi:8-oxo-dGTP pyrophosphatase MutT (NUDIX family)